MAVHCAGETAATVEARVTGGDATIAAATMGNLANANTTTTVTIATITTAASSVAATATNTSENA